jgi:hypothetical protein
VPIRHSRQQIKLILTLRNHRHLNHWQPLSKSEDYTHTIAGGITNWKFASTSPNH